MSNIRHYMMPKQPLFKPLKDKRKIFEQISEQIKELIFSGVLKPGDKLPPEKELSKQFNTARLVVREALRILEQSGLVYIKQGNRGGSFIKALDASVISRSISDLVKSGNVTHRGLTEARLAIELDVLDFAIQRITKNDLVLLGENIEEMERQLLGGVPTDKTSLEFHILIAKASKNYLFEAIVESIINEAARFIQSFNPDADYAKRVLKSHKKIYHAIKEKNLREAREEMEKHLLNLNRKYFTLAKKK